MKAWQVNEFGGLDAMAYTEVTTPQPAHGEVRVKVHASGMNFAETRMRSGTYSGQQIPFLLGMELAGVVDAVGEGVSQLAVGDAVFGRARGAHAQYVCVEAAHLFAKPASLSFEQAAAIPVGWLTAWHALRTVAPCKPGDRVLIEAVASSVGIAALQIAKQRGCWVAGTASRDEKLARAAQYGLDAAYNYKRENFAARLLADTDGQGADIGMMTIGEETATQLFDAMGILDDTHILNFIQRGNR
jgi:NADPH2:quinone reductase